MSKVPTFLKRDGDSLLFNQEGQFVFYVPEIYFDRNFARIEGEYVNLIGVLDYAIFTPDGGNNGLKRFYFPTIFLCKPCRMEKAKKLHLKKMFTEGAAIDDEEPLGDEPLDEDPQINDYRLLIFEKGDAVVVSTKVAQNIKNVEDFYQVMVISGKLPTTVPYGKLQNYFIDSIALNGSSYGMSLQMFGIIASELCRDPRDPSKAFRHTHFRDEYSYKPMSIKNIPKYISPSSSISSENWDLGLMGAIMNPTDTESPMEKLLMGS